MNTSVMFSSKKDEWSTPQELFDELNKEFLFDVDVCALPQNAKCKWYYTPTDDGLSKPWIGNVWCNPPYGKHIGSWVEKAFFSAKTGVANVVVMLLPARTDTKWFHEYIYKKRNVEVRFVKGRLKFGDAKSNAPFPSMIVVFRSEVLEV